MNYPIISENTKHCDIYELFNTVSTDPNVTCLLRNDPDQIYSRSKGSKKEIFFVFNTNTYQASISIDAYETLLDAVNKGVTFEELDIMFDTPV